MTRPYPKQDRDDNQADALWILQVGLEEIGEAAP